VRVTWDETKNVANQRKHGISFEEAREIFKADYVEIYDDAHSDGEERFIAIGPISRGIVLVVSTEPDASTIRIISARVASRREHQLFRAYMETHR
jgi:uncharacterized DUF497 family protein